MKNKVKVLHLKGGITLTIIMAQKRYEVAILIPKEVHEKEIKIRNRQVNLRLKSMKSHDEPITITVQGIYKEDDYGMINIENWSKNEFTTENYCGRISLNPECYIPSNIRRKVKKYWDSYRENAKEIKPLPSQNCKTSTASKFTNYSHNNATSPYRGGSVSPK